MIALGIPTNEYIKADTVSSLLLLVKDNPNITEFIIEQSPLVHLNREKIVLKALKTNCSHLLFIDSDMKFGSLILQKLLAHDKDIVGLVYRLKNKTATPVIYKEKGKMITDINDVPRKLFKCYAVGTGIMLIKLSVFKKIKRPWFFFGKQDEQHGGYGEDIWFCRQAHEAGVDVWVDGMLECGHIGNQVF